MRLRHALRADLPTIADLWVDAFAGDPYLRWLEPDDARWPDFGRAWMTFIVELTFERGHTYLDDRADVAVAWIPPDLSFAGPADVARGRDIIAATAGAVRADQAVVTVLAARAHAVDEPHWTLQYLGVRSGRQGAGLGIAAVTPMLDVCDDEGLPCALVSTNPRNLGFYERLGFGVDAEVTTPDGTATLRPMHRPPPGVREPRERPA
jgi:GNAT superfamily N-acetyltransferase